MRFKSPIPANPTTTVEKMIGAISIFTRLTNASPSGRSFTPHSGCRKPSKPPTAMPIRTWM
jgi:hypothetical protein